MRYSANEDTTRRRRVANLPYDTNIQRRVSRRVENMSREQVEHIRESNRVENMSSERVENIRASRRVENMTDQQIMVRRLRNRVDRMNPETREGRNFRRTLDGMSQQQLAHARALNVSRLRFKLIRQEWDYDNPCEHCHCIFLKSDAVNRRKLCCQRGKFLEDGSNFPKLFQLPMYLRDLMLNYTEHFSPKSSYYNNTFSIASTGYDNGQDIGCERIHGPAALKMNGRVYHYIPQCANERFGGIGNFTYDGNYQLVEEHANSINADRQDPNVRIPFLKGIFLLLIVIIFYLKYKIRFVRRVKNKQCILL